MKPFVKWAGGKSKLIGKIEEHLPEDFCQQEEVTYVEPFVGGGAMLFHMLKTHPNITRAIINDINADLINTYIMVKENPARLIESLRMISKEYLSQTDPAVRENIYYRMRNDYNRMNPDDGLRVPYFIFLNQTCFNGLYRVNTSGLFNVPHGKYKNPRIWTDENLFQLSELLQNVEITSGDFADVFERISGRYVFVYFDPPYRPLETGTAAFTQYNKQKFDDKSQERLKRLCDQMTERGWRIMVSNSDSKKKGQPYFDVLYENYHIHRFSANRTINVYSAPDLSAKEILITNY